MRTGPITAALTVLAALAALLVAPATPATARTCSTAPSTPSGQVVPVVDGVPLVARETRIHWTRTTVRVTYGDGAMLEGQVISDDGALPEAAVDLYARPSGQEKWERVASTTSDSQTGVFAFGCLLPRRTTSYRASYRGALLYTASEGERRVGVGRRVPDAMRQVGPASFVYSGSVTPRYAGAVTLQRRDCPGCAWRSVDRVRTGTRSRWRFAVDTSRLSGEHAYRAMIPADRRFARSLSERIWRITSR